MKPILFSTPMVQAILAGNKTMTRRIIKHFGNSLHYGTLLCDWGLSNPPYIENGILKWTLQTEVDDAQTFKIKPRYQPGDILWVRETWRIAGWDEGEPFTIEFKDGRLKHDVFLNEERAEDYWIECTDQCINAGFKTDENDNFIIPKGKLPTKWRPSIFMPKAAALIFLKVTDVKVERLQDISEEDAMKEGVELNNKGWKCYLGSEMRNTAKQSFISLWESINGKGSWEKNPWVWVYSFEKLNNK